MPGAKFIQLELLAIFIAFFKKKWSSEDHILLNGNFSALVDLLPNKNYRTIIENQHLINIEITNEKILFKPEEMTIKKSEIIEKLDLKRVKRIIDVIEEHKGLNLIEKLQLAFTIYPASEICKRPKLYKLEYFSENEKVRLAHEANFQAQLNSQISSYHDKFITILEKKYNIDESSYKKPDIVFDFENSQLFIELKLGNKKNIISNFNDDIEKISENYPFAIAICYDPKQHIKKDNNIFFNKTKNTFIVESKDRNKHSNTPIYFCMEREMVKAPDFNFKNGKRSLTLNEIETINMAFCIYKKETF